MSEKTETKTETKKDIRKILIDPSSDQAFAKSILSHANDMVKYIAAHNMPLDIKASPDRSITFTEVRGSVNGRSFIVKRDKPKKRSEKDQLWISYGVPHEDKIFLYTFPLDWDDKLRFNIDIVYTIDTAIAGRDKINGHYTYDENAEEFILKPTDNDLSFYNNKDIKKPGKFREFWKSTWNFLVGNSISR